MSGSVVIVINPDDSNDALCVWVEDEEDQLNEEE